MRGKTSLIDLPWHQTFYHPSMKRQDASRDTTTNKGHWKQNGEGLIKTTSAVPHTEQDFK